jgi:hypothetical protein
MEIVRRTVFGPKLKVCRQKMEFLVQLDNAIDQILKRFPAQLLPVPISRPKFGVRSLEYEEYQPIPVTTRLLQQVAINSTTT